MLTLERVRELEFGLKSPDYELRLTNCTLLHGYAVTGQIEIVRPEVARFNLHAHSFHSFSANYLSPSALAWLAFKNGLDIIGMVDFDNLDGASEFVEACQILDMKGFMSLETRVVFPNFKGFEINSPGEPGISYQIGVGFHKPVLGTFLEESREISLRRVEQMIRRIDRRLTPVCLGGIHGVQHLTPSGYTTERHVCIAYVHKAEQVFPDLEERRAFWGSQLGSCPSTEAELQALIRAQMMKKSGPGYITTDDGSFPDISLFNSFVTQQGGLPTIAWLNGDSTAESDLDRLLKESCALGCQAINIIPARNFCPNRRDRHLEMLSKVVAKADELHLPVLIGTELNSPGQQLFDDLSVPELRDMAPIFERGALTVYGHAVMQRYAMGYNSPWAKTMLPDLRDRNQFFETVGRNIRPSNERLVARSDVTNTPHTILDWIAISMI